MNMEKDGDRGYTAGSAEMEAGERAEESSRLMSAEEGEDRAGCASPGRSCGAPAMGEHWYRVVVDNMSEAAVVVGSDGTIVYGNARFCEMLALAPETIAGCSMTQFLSEKECPRFESIFLDERQGSGKGEFVLAASDGRPVPVQVSGKKVDTGEAEAICLIISDISLRKRAEEALRNSHEELEKRVGARTEELTATNEQLKREARDRVHAEHSLRESEEHFRLLIENALDIIMVLKEDCTVMYAGPSLKRILGYTTREFVGRNLLDFVDTDGRDRVAERLAQAVHIPGSTLALEARMRHKDGGRRTIEMISRNLLHDRKVAGIVVNGRDITERKQMEEKLRRAHDELEARVEERTSELRSAYERLEVEIREHKEAEEERARLATAIEQGGDCVIITDSLGIIQYVNPAFERTSLYSREEMTGRDFNTLSEGTKDRAFWDEMWAALRAGNVWTGRITNRKKDGNTYEVERSVSPIRDNEGNVTNYVAVERDMTEQAGLEAELRQAQKMQAIGTLAGGIAHDFNNILAAMIGFTELAIDDVGEAGRAKRHLEHVRKAGFRGRELVKQILTFSREGEQEKKAVQVAPIVREVVNLMRASLPSTVEIRSKVETEEGIIFADPVQIHQLLINLCTNAGQAMRATKGVLELRVGDFALAPGAEPPHPDLEPGTYVKLSVTDTGPGIDDLIKDRIFEPFFTTRRTEGAGMGLSVVYGIVKSHHGAITVTSAPGKGSTFTVYFKKLREVISREEKTRAGRAAKGKGRILFVDDEEALVEIAKQMLERLGYEVVAERDSTKALKHFQREPERFDLVITDQTMPNMTGIELAKKLMSIKKDIPIILCTGFSEVISPESARAMGIREFVMKPIIKNEMAETIRRVINGGRDEKKKQ